MKWCVYSRHSEVCLVTTLCTDYCCFQRKVKQRTQHGTQWGRVSTTDRFKCHFNSSSVHLHLVAFSMKVHFWVSRAVLTGILVCWLIWSLYQISCVLAHTLAASHKACPYRGGKCDQKLPTPHNTTDHYWAGALKQINHWKDNGYTCDQWMHMELWAASLIKHLQLQEFNLVVCIQESLRHVVKIKVFFSFWCYSLYSQCFCSTLNKSSLPL